MGCASGWRGGMSSRFLQLCAAAASPPPPPLPPPPPPYVNRGSVCYCLVLRAARAPAAAALSLPAAPGTRPIYVSRRHEATVHRSPCAAARDSPATAAPVKLRAAAPGAAKAAAAAATEVRDVAAAAVRSTFVSSPSPAAHCYSRILARQFHPQSASPAAAAVAHAGHRQMHFLSSYATAASPSRAAALGSAASVSDSAAMTRPPPPSAASATSRRDAAAPDTPLFRAADAGASLAPPRTAASRARAAAAVAETPAAAVSLPEQLLSLPEFLLRRHRRFPPAQQQQAAFDLAVVFESLSALSCSTTAAGTARASALAPGGSGGAIAPAPAANWHAAAPSLPALSIVGAAAAASTAVSSGAVAAAGAVAARAAHPPVVELRHRQQSYAGPLLTDAAAPAAGGGLHPTRRVRGKEEVAVRARRLWSAAVETAKANSDVLQVPQLLGIVHAAARANIKIPSFATKMRQRALQVVAKISNPHAFLRLLLDLEKMEGLNDRQLLLFRDAIAGRLLHVRTEEEKMREIQLQEEKPLLRAGRGEGNMHLQRAGERRRQTHAARRRESEKGSPGAGTRICVKARQAAMPAGERGTTPCSEEVREAPKHSEENRVVAQLREEHVGCTGAEDGKETSDMRETEARGGRQEMHAVDSKVLVPAPNTEGRNLLLQTTNENTEPLFLAREKEEAPHGRRGREAALLHARERRGEASVLMRPAPPFVIVMLLHLLAKHRIRDMEILMKASSRLLHEEVALLAALRQTPALLPTLVLSLAKLEAGGCCKLLLEQLLEKHAFPVLSELRVQELLNLAYALVCLHTQSQVIILDSGSDQRQQEPYPGQQQQQDDSDQEHQQGQARIQQRPEEHLWAEQQAHPHTQQQQHAQCIKQVQQLEQQASAQQRQSSQSGRSCNRGRDAGGQDGERTVVSSEVLKPLLAAEHLQQRQHVHRGAASEVQDVSHAHVPRNSVPTKDNAELARPTTAFSGGYRSFTGGMPTPKTADHFRAPVKSDSRAWNDSAIPSTAAADIVTVPPAGADVVAATPEKNTAAVAASSEGGCLRPLTSGSASTSAANALVAVAATDKLGTPGHVVASPAVGAAVASAVGGGSGAAADFTTAVATTSVAAGIAAEERLSSSQPLAVASGTGAALPATHSNLGQGFACSSEQLHRRSLLLTATLRLLLQRLRRDREAKATAASSIAWRQLKFVDAYLAHGVGPLRLVGHQQQLEQEQQQAEHQQWRPQTRLRGKQLARSSVDETVQGEILSLLLQARQQAVNNVVRISELQKRVGSMLLQHEIEGLAVEQPVGPFVLDFAIPSKRIAVEIDGEAHFYLHTNVPTARTRFKRELLTAMGWHVVVVPEQVWKQKRKTKVNNFVTKKVREALTIEDKR